MNKAKAIIFKQCEKNNITPQEAKLLLEKIGHQPAEADPTDTSVAIVGYDCLLPGADSPGELWHNLINGVDSVSDFPKARAEDVIYLNNHAYSQLSEFSCRVGGYLDSIDQFDPHFFNFKHIQAQQIDPLQRQFMIVAYKALEHAGLSHNILNSYKVGTFVGYSYATDNYYNILNTEDADVAIDNQPAMTPYRLGYLFNFDGPALLIDTTCSSSLTALNTAQKAIQHGDCDIAIVGGVNLHIYPALKEISNLGVDAFDGKVKAFDQAANGTNIGEGIVACVLTSKRLANEANLKVRSVLKASGTNSDGASNGITSPNPGSQSKLLNQVWQSAGLNANDIGFIEAHGTGTKLGDPAEISGIKMALDNLGDTVNTQVPIGTIKTNLGHTEAASGLTGFLKAVLSVEQRLYPKNLHFHKASMLIDFDNLPLFVPTENHKLATDKPIVGCVSSFGMTGTNAHAVITSYESKEDCHTESSDSIFNLLFITARSQTSLVSLCESYHCFIQKNKDVIDINDLCACSLIHRNHFEYKIVMLVTSRDDLLDSLASIIAQAQTKPEQLNNPGLANAILQGSLNTDIKSQLFTDLGASFRKNIIKYMTSNNVEAIIEKFQEMVSNYKFIDLPMYEFDLRRCWAKLKVQKEDLPHQLDNLFFKLNWVQEDYNLLHQQERFQLGQTLVFADFNNSQQLQIFRYLQKSELNITCVHFGPKPAPFNASFNTTVCDQQGYKKIFDELTQENIQFESIIHLGNCLGDDEVAQHSLDNLLKLQEFGVLSLLCIIKAMSQYYDRRSKMKLLVFSSNTHRIQGHDDQTSYPEKITSMGVSLVASQEFPLVESLFVDIDEPSCNPNTLSKILQESCHEDTFKQPMVCYRKGLRYVQILDKLATDNVASRQLAVDRDHYFVLVGGAGYLGLETAKEVAQKSATNFILVGRSDLSFINQKDADLYNLSTHQQYILKKIATIREMGSTVKYLQADFTSEAGFKDVTKCLKDAHLEGIFLCLKNISHEKLVDVDVHLFKRNILSKLKAIFFANKLRSSLNNNAYLFLYSSISSITGGPTGADCCAVNLYQDALSELPGNPNNVVMNYTLIEADDGSLLSDRMSMIPPLSLDQFHMCLRQFLDYHINFAVVANFEPRVMRMVLDFMKIRFSEPLLSAFNAPEKDKSASNHQPSIVQENPHSSMELSDRDSLVDIMCDIWKKVLGVSTISVSDNFFELGGDSIAAVKLTHTIKEKIGFEFEVTTLYSYPTIAQLVDNGMTAVDHSSNDESDLSELLDKLDEGGLTSEELLNQIEKKS